MTSGSPSRLSRLAASAGVNRRSAIRSVSTNSPGGGKDAADFRFAAVRRVGGRGPALQVLERVPGPGEFGNAPFHPGQMLVDQGADVLARGLPRVADGQHAADVGEGEPGRLGV